MAKYIFEVLEEVSKKKTKAEKIDVLKKNESWALKDVLKGSLDEVVVWNLPTGAPPYTAAEEHNHPANLIRENRNFKYLFKGGPGDSLPAVKRERIFIQILEAVHPQDAMLVIDMINKKKPTGVTKALVNEAFPGLITK